MHMPTRDKSRSHEFCTKTYTLVYLGLIFPDQNQSENFGADLQSGPEISDHEQTIHISIFKYFDTLAF